MQYKNSIVTSIQYEIKLFCTINAMIIYRNEMVGNKCMKAILLLCIWSRLSVGPKCDNTVIVHTDFNRALNWFIDTFIISELSSCKQLHSSLRMRRTCFSKVLLQHFTWWCDVLTKNFYWKTSIKSLFGRKQYLVVKYW